MFFHYLKRYLKELRRNRLHTCIAILGLSVGLACCFLAVLWSQYENSYDRFHSNFDRIYRAVITTDVLGRKSYVNAPYRLGSVLKSNFPETKNFARVSSFSAQRIQYQDRIRNIHIHGVDPSFFQVFSFPFLQGNPARALTELSSIVLTEKVAKEIFGDEDPISKILLCGAEKLPFQVSGIVKNPPENSHLQFSLIVPVDNQPRFFKLWQNDLDDWSKLPATLYIEFQKGVNKRNLEIKVNGYLKENYWKDLSYKLSLQPLKDIHLRSRFMYERVNPGSIDQKEILIFLYITIAVLVVSCINYTVLSIAISLKRIKEIAVRKINGAGRLDIVKQFMGETLFSTFLAFIVALVLAQLGLPLLRDLTGRPLTLNILNMSSLSLSFFGIAFITGLAAGLYPAVFVSSFEPSHALKIALHGRKKSSFPLRRLLIIVQFIFPLALMSVTLVIYSQLYFMNNKDLGFNPDNIITVPLHNLANRSERIEAFKHDLLQHSGILSVAAGISPSLDRKTFEGVEANLANQDVFDWEGKNPGDSAPSLCLFADPDYLNVYKIKIVEGRFFSEKHPEDVNNYVLNETAIRAMNIKAPIGKAFSLAGKKGQIIGIVNDFHLGTLEIDIPPTVFAWSLRGELSIRLAPQSIQGALKHVETVWKSFNPEKTWEFKWLTDDLDQLYIRDRKNVRQFTMSAFLSMIISSLGLFGMVALMAEERTKEIGVRKVLGASTASIIHLMLREFLIQIAIAAAIAWPVAFILVSRWLQNYSYRINIEIWMFVLPGIVSLGIILATVGSRIYRTAKVEPVIALKYE